MQPARSVGIDAEPAIQLSARPWDRPGPDRLIQLEWQSAGAPAQQVRRQHVSWNFFDGLGVPPVLGRSFLEEEDRPGAEPAIVVSHRFWSSRLGRDPDAIDRVVRINDEPARIVGVAPPGFFGLDRGEWIDVYQPLATHPFYQVQAPPSFSPRESADSAAGGIGRGTARTRQQAAGCVRRQGAGPS